MQAAHLLAVASLALAGVPYAQDDVQEKPLAEQGYLGLSLRDIPSGHSVVSWILPGPLQGEGITAPGSDLARPDLLVAIDGKALNADAFRDYVRSLSPGTTVTLEVRRSNRRGGTIPDGIDHEEMVRTLEVVLASRDEWTGTIDRGRGHAGQVAFITQPLLCPQDAYSDLGKAIREHDLQEPLDTLTGVFADYLAENDDFHSLSRVRAPFESPFSLPELEQIVTNPTHEVPEDPFVTAMALLSANLDIRPGRLKDDKWLSTFNRRVLWPVLPGEDFWFDVHDHFGDTDYIEDFLSFLRVPRRSFYMVGPDTKDHVSVIRYSMDFDWAGLLQGFGSLHTLARIPKEDVSAGLESFRSPSISLESLGIEGEVLGWELSQSRVVIGGEGPNRYDMALIDLVIDLGGNDEYYASKLDLGNRVVIDLA